jgi:hypothetical protein
MTRRWSMMMKTSENALAGRLTLASTQLLGRKREEVRLPVEKPAWFKAG